MRKKVFITALLFMFVIGAVFAEKGDIRLSYDLGNIGEISYALTDHAVLGVYLAYNYVYYPHSDIDVSLYSTPSSVISPVTFGIMGGWNFLNDKNNEFLLGGMVDYGDTTFAPTGKDVMVNSAPYSQYDFVTSFSGALLARYTYTFNFGLSLGASLDWIVLFNAYNINNTYNNEKYPIVYSPGGTLSIGWKFHL